MTPTVAVEDILITAELDRRPSRPPNYVMENQALAALADSMARDPQQLPQQLTDLAVELCRAGSAGISLLRQDDDGEFFHWIALSGVFAPYIGGRTPRHFSPCGATLDRNSAQLFVGPARLFTYLYEVDVPIVEALIVPFSINGRVAGTIWIVAHNDQQFDAEDVRLLTSLARFTGAALQINLSLEAAKATNQALAVEISERKHAEEKLRDSERKFARVFHSGPLVITITKLSDGRIIEVNESFVRMTGYTREEALGRTPVELGFWVEPMRRAEGLAQFRAGSFVRNTEVRFRMKDGRERTCLISAEMIEISGETCVVTVINDITERKQAEEALRQLNTSLEKRVLERTAELERSNRELDQFAYVASHDLKAPLRAISLLAGWIQEDAFEVLPTPSKTHFEKLQQRIQRMDTLLNDLLAYSRAGRQRHIPENVDSAALVKQIVELLGPPASFTVSVAEPMPVLYTEQVALDIVLRNLIGNAFKHHHQPDGGHVRVTAQEEADWVEFVIADDGPGIEAQFHERIFGVFQTLRPRDEVEGSGMGLALVKRLVEMRDGTIQIESAPGQGTTFRFTWPKLIPPPANSL